MTTHEPPGVLLQANPSRQAFRQPTGGSTPGTETASDADRSTSTADLPYTADAARRARSELARVLDGRCEGPAADVAALLTSELVTNAILHASPPVRLRVAITSPAIRVEVHDGSIDMPDPRRTRSTDPNGRGFAILAALASRWGVERTAEGKLVWFELVPRVAP